MSQTLRLLSCAAFLAVGMTGVSAGTGSCTAAAGATVDGGSCCTALGATGCTCDESNASVNGVVTCSASTIKDGSKAEVKSAIGRPSGKLQLNTGGGGGGGNNSMKLQTR